MTRPLLLDEMLSPMVAEQLRARGHDALAITERPDLVGLSDEQVLTIGSDEDRALITLNISDFAALHADWQATGRSQAGLVYVSTETFPQDRAFLGAVINALDKAAQAGELPELDEIRFLKR